MVSHEDFIVVFMYFCHDGLWFLAFPFDSFSQVSLFAPITHLLYMFSNTFLNIVIILHFKLFKIFRHSFNIYVISEHVSHLLWFFNLFLSSLLHFLYFFCCCCKLDMILLHHRNWDKQTFSQRFYVIWLAVGLCLMFVVDIDARGLELLSILILSPLLT